MDLYKHLEGMNVALIEDDQWIQSGLRMLFHQNGCHLHGFESAALAMEAMKSERFDIIVSDYWLPDLDGLSLLRNIREYQPDAIMILITAYPTDAIREEAAREGIHDFLEKPLTMEKLEKSLMEQVSRLPKAAGGEGS